MGSKRILFKPHPYKTIGHPFAQGGATAIDDCKLILVKLSFFLNSVAERASSHSSIRLGSKKLSVALLQSGEDNESTSSFGESHSDQATTKVKLYEPASAIEVFGVGGNTRQETVHSFFENRRKSAGGPIEDIHYKQGEKMYQITFQDPKGNV